MQLAENEGLYLGRKQSSNNDNHILHQHTSGTAASPGTLLCLPQQDWDAASYYSLNSRHSTAPPAISLPTRPPRRARSKADILRRKGSPSSPDMMSNTDRAAISAEQRGEAMSRVHETTGRIFEFVPSIKPRKSAPRVSYLSSCSVRSFGSEVAPSSHDFLVEPRPSVDNTFITSRPFSRHGHRTLPSTVHNAWPEKRRSG